MKVFGFRVSHWTLITAGVSLALFAWLLLGDSDEEKIRARIEGIAHAVGSKSEENLAFRALRLKSTFQEGMVSNVLFSAAELSDTTGVHELTQLAATAPRAFGEFDVSVGSTEIAIDKKSRQASAVSELTLTGISDTVNRDTRRVRFSLIEQKGEWRISKIDVEARTE